MIIGGGWGNRRMIYLKFGKKAVFSDHKFVYRRLSLLGKLTPFVKVVGEWVPVEGGWRFDV